MRKLSVLVAAATVFLGAGAAFSQGVDRLYVLDCGWAHASDQSRWSPGINVGVPATMAMFPFTGWNESFFGDLHIQGREGVQFFTQQKVISTRWFGEGVGDVWKK